MPESKAAEQNGPPPVMVSADSLPAGFETEVAGKQSLITTGQMKSILTQYDMYGNPINGVAVIPETNFPTHVRNQPEPSFNDVMNNMNFRSNMHDMRDLMKSLN